MTRTALASLFALALAAGAAQAHSPIGGAPVLWRPAPRSWRLKDQRARSATDECRRSSVSN